jgi:GH43 family beta-xylosidase
MKNQPETTYRVIGSGQGEWVDGGSFTFYRPGYHSTLEAALADYNELEADPTYDAAVVIRVRHEDWAVIREFGTEGLTVSCSPLFVFRLEKTPELVLV